MKHYHRIPLMLCSFCAASLSVVAQNNTNLPTSMYGVGELSTSDSMSVHRFHTPVIPFRTITAPALWAIPTASA